ncbi:MAG: BatA domain-containing protein [Planctomycetota bacterium]|jgi:hypothetical protein
MTTPWALLGLLLIPVLILLERWRRRPRAMVWPSLLLWRTIGPGEAKRQRRIEPLLLLECLAVALLSLAAAGPTFAAGNAPRVVVVHLDTSPRMQAKLADGRTALEATRDELDRVRAALAPADEWRLVEGVDSAPVTGDIRILASNRPDADGELIVARAAAGFNIGIDAVDATGFAIRCEGDGPVRVQVDGATRTVQPDVWIEANVASEVRILDENNLDLDDEVRLRPLRLKVRTDAGSPLVLAALRVGVPAEAGEPPDFILTTTGGTPVGRVRGRDCVAGPGLFEGLFLDDCRWDGVRGTKERGLLRWKEWTLARWQSDNTLWLGMPVDREWDGHGTLALVIERAKRKLVPLREGEELRGDVAVTPATGFIATLGVDRPWDGTLPPAVPDGEGIFRMRALLGFAAAVVLGIYAVRLGRTPTHHP